MGLRGNGLWCQKSLQNAWGTYFDNITDAVKLMLQDVPAIKTYPATSPGQVLLEVLSRVLLDGSICPPDYPFRPDFENFMHWAAQRLVLCKSTPILSTLDEETTSRVNKSIMLLAVKQALYNLVVFKLGRHVLLPWGVRTSHEIPRKACELFDETLDSAVIATVGAGTMGTSVPSHVERFGEDGFQCFVAIQQNFVVRYMYNTAAAVRIELVHGEEREDVRRRFPWLDDFYRNFPADETGEDEFHQVPEEWKGDWVVSFARLETPFKGAMDAAGCISIVIESEQSASQSPYYDLVQNGNKVEARLAENVKNIIREEHGLINMREARMRHVRGRLWQREYAASNCERLISTGELLMVLHGVTSVDALNVSTQGLHIPLREACQYRLFFSRMLTNDEGILQDELLKLNGAIGQDGVLVTRRAYGITKKGPYLLVHVVSDTNELLVRFVLDGTVRYSKLMRKQIIPRCSLITVLNMGENVGLVHSQPRLRDVFGGIVSDGLFQVSTQVGGGREGCLSRMMRIPEQFLCTMNGKKYEVILRREVEERDGVHYFSNRVMPGRADATVVSTGTGVLHASI